MTSGSVKHRRWPILIALLLATPLVDQAALAATVSAAPGNANCVVKLTGAIEEGDLERFKNVASQVFPVSIGESTGANTVCLDSPGGSFVEGVRLAAHFYETGVGTVVDQDASCYSACSIMFMMGRAVGDEVSFINRRLHVRGSLGFHRPSLSLPDDVEVGAQDVEASYDLAVSSVVEFLVLANHTAPWSSQPMVRSDLIERMFATRGDDIYLIETVEQAARWNIELIGVKFPESIDEAQAYYACENTLQWQVGLHENPIDYVSLTLGGHLPRPYSVLVTEDSEGQLFDVVSRKAGYASAGCLVHYRAGRLRMCATDEYTGFEIGRGVCEATSAYELSAVDALAIWSPSTRIEDTDSEYSVHRLVGVCQVLSQGRIVDDERCSVTVSNASLPNGSKVNVHTFSWPSGSRTVIRTNGYDVEINGVSADREFVDGYDACFLNTQSGNLFCFVAR